MDSDSPKTSPELSAGALVTGAARRVGAHIAMGLAKAGFSVAIHCNGSRMEAEALALRLVAEGHEAVVVEADLSDRDACAGLIEKAAGLLKRPVRLLVNNASLFENDTAEDFDWDVWDRHFALHLKAPVELSRRMAENLPDGAEGLVVNIIDQRVWRLNPNFFSYTLSKSALWTATRTMAQTFAPRIRVNGIGPGPALRNSRQNEADFDAQVAAVPLGRGPELDEIVDAILFLWRSRSVTGQMIALDGGQHLAWQTPDVVGVVE